MPIQILQTREIAKMNSKVSLIVVVTALFGIPFSSARLREFEESCSMYKPTENCRPDLDLVCHDNVCACKEKAFYDKERKACISQIGETCTKDPNSLGIFSGGNYPTISRCPLNAVCEDKDPNKTPDIPATLKGYDGSFGGMSQQTSTRCLCKRGFYPADNNQRCIAALEHNETCSGELVKIGKTCDSAAGLFCADSKTCLCKENTHYDKETRRCLTTVGEVCNSSTFCEKNAICSTVLESYKSRYGNMFGRRVNPGSRPQKKDDGGKNTGKCGCLPGYTMNVEGKCTGSFSVGCSAENPCNSDKFLSCIDGICQCQAGSHQAFSSEENSTCVLLPGSSCHALSGPKCVVNSACSDTGHCQCKNGFSESPSGKCLLSFENECVMPESQISTPYNYHPRPQPTATPLNESCNYYQGLSCKGNKCECFDTELKWDSKKRMCTAGVNERCGSVAMMRTTEFDYQSEMFYPTASVTRRYVPGNFVYISSYFVACAEGHTCTKNHNDIDGWRVCEKKV